MSIPLIARLRQRAVDGEHTLIHYAWIIVAVGGFAQLAGSAVRQSFGVLVDPLTVDFNWSASSVGLVYAVMSLVTALMSPVAGWLGNNFGARRTMLLGTAFFLTGMVWTSTVGHLWELFVAYGMLLGAAQALLLVPVVPALALWFRRHLGLGTGVMMLSWSAGPAIVVQLMAILLSSAGWQTTFLAVGGVGTGVLLVLISLFRDSPEQAGRRAYGWRPGERTAPSSGREYVKRARTFQGYVYRTNAFWNLINIHFLGCAGHAVILVGIVPMAIHQGLTPIAAAGVLSTFTGVSIVTRFLTPVLSDSFGSKRVMFFAFAGQGLAVLLLLGNPGTAMFYIFAVAFALPYGGEGTAFPIINRQYYGHSPMGTTFGWQLLGAGLGMALGGLLPGITFDISNSYTIAIVLSAGFSFAGAAAIVLLEATRRPLIPDWDADDTAIPRPSIATAGVVAAAGGPVPGGD